MSVSGLTNVQVRITSAIAGRPAYALGEEVDLEPAVAAAWIADGLAVPVREDAPEAAAVATSGLETAVTAGRRRR